MLGCARVLVLRQFTERAHECVLVNIIQPLQTLVFKIIMFQICELSETRLSQLLPNFPRNMFTVEVTLERRQIWRLEKGTEKQKECVVASDVTYDWMILSV